MLKLNEIYNMNCLDGLKLLDDECVDLTVTSPPYDNLRTYNGYSFDFENIARELYRVTKKGGVVVWVVGDATIKGSETGTSFRQVLYFMSLGFNLHDTMIYHKRGGLMTGSINCYIQKFEYMFVLTKGKIKTVNIIKDKKLKHTESRTKKHRKKDGTFDIQNWSCGGFGRRENIWTYDVGLYKTTKDKIAFKHPAIFPEMLCKDHIISWSNENDIVLDPFMGSGTTAKMALLLNRQFIGFEISEEYCQMANKRIEARKNQMDIFNDFGAIDE